MLMREVVEWVDRTEPALERASSTARAVSRLAPGLSGRDGPHEISRDASRLNPCTSAAAPPTAHATKGEVRPLGGVEATAPTAQPVAVATSAEARMPRSCRQVAISRSCSYSFNVCVCSRSAVPRAASSSCRCSASASIRAPSAASRSSSTCG